MSQPLKKNLPEEVQTSKPDVAKLMLEIRAKIKAEASKDKLRPFKPYQASATDPSKKDTRTIMQSEDLAFINNRRTYSEDILKPGRISSHRQGIGRYIAKLKQYFAKGLIKHVFPDYFNAEQEFHLHLVKFLNDMARHVHGHDTHYFWELVRKIDYDVNKALTRIERINDQQDASLRSTERGLHDSLNSEIARLSKEIATLQAKQREQDSAISTLEAVSSGLEKIVENVSRVRSDSPQVQQSLPSTTEVDYSYLIFENRYRGGEDEVKQRLEIYPKIFLDVATVIGARPVLEIGCGRGELLELFKENQIKAYGVDMDSGMIEHCRSKGLEVVLANAMEHLSGLADASLGGLIGVQLVEHLTQSQLENLCSLAKRKVVPGGRIVFETIDASSIVAQTLHYTRDPTHKWPLQPDTLESVVNKAGLKVVEIRKLREFSPETQMRNVIAEDYMTPRWKFMLETLNHNFSVLNKLLFGHQDYCIIAEV